MTPRTRQLEGRRRHAAGATVPAIALAVAMAAWLAAAPASAALVDVRIRDAAGVPLADAVALLEPVGARAPVKPMADVEISQAKRHFNPRVTLITVGTRVTFPNFDTVRHQVYSFSPIKTFEIKLYAGVPTIPVVFDKPGIAVLGCNIHDSMAAWVVVADTPWTARTAADGHARLDGVPPGNYRLRTWHPGLAADTEGPAVPVTVGNADLDLPVSLPVGSGS